MKITYYLAGALLAIAPLSMTSCSSLAKMAGADLSGVPGVGSLLQHQDALIVQYGKATETILQAQLTCFKSLDEHETAKEIDKHIQQLKENPNGETVMNSTTIAREYGQKLQSRISERSNAEGIRNDLWSTSVKQLNDALILEGKLGVDCALRGAALAKSMKNQSSVNKALMATEFRPLIYFVANLPKDYELYNETQQIQKKFSEHYQLPYPKLPVLPSNPMKNISSSGIQSMLGI